MINELYSGIVDNFLKINNMKLIIILGFIGFIGI